MAGAALLPSAAAGAAAHAAWTLLSGHVLQMVVQMLQSCHLQVRTHLPACTGMASGLLLRLRACLANRPTALPNVAVMPSNSIPAVPPVFVPQLSGKGGDFGVGGVTGMRTHHCKLPWLQDDPLVKHCLDYIAVIASHAYIQQQADKALPAAAGDGASSSGAAAGAAEGGDAAAKQQAIAELLCTACEGVLAAARAACDTRLQAVVLRTLAMLIRYPGYAALSSQVQPLEAIDLVVRVGKAAKRQADQAVNKDVFLVQVRVAATAAQRRSSTCRGSACASRAGRGGFGQRFCLTGCRLDAWAVAMQAACGGILKLHAGASSCSSSRLRVWHSPIPNVLPGPAVLAAGVQLHPAGLAAQLPLPTAAHARRHAAAARGSR